MDHKVKFNAEKSLVTLDVVGKIDVDDVGEIQRSLEPVHENNGHNVSMLCDLSDADMESLLKKDTRTRIADTVIESGYEKIAFVGLSMPVRMISKIVIALLKGKAQSKFFSDIYKAYAWIGNGN